MADRKNATVDRSQAAAADTRVDGAGTEAHLEELASSNDAVLALGQGGDPPFAPTSRSFTLTVMANLRLEGNRPMVARTVAPMVRMR